jgi:MarR family transcriptional regulator, organic hydroperoxide resistance regulator
MADSEWFLPLLAMISKGMKANVDKALMRRGARVGQQFILEVLWSEDGLAPGELSKRIGVETPTVTQAVKRMEAAGLVGRRRDPSDARLVRVFLTARGTALKKLVPADLAATTRAAFAGLSRPERVTLRKALERIAANLS